MGSFFSTQMDYILFCSGLASVLLAGILYSLPDRRNSAIPWKWLALFGLFHGISEWMNMFALSQGDALPYAEAGLLFMAGALLCLVEFGRTGTAFIAGKSPRRWIILPLLALSAVGIIKGTAGTDATVRYVLGLTGGLWAAWALHQHHERECPYSSSLSVSVWTMALYALASVFAVPKMPFFPASMLNHESFLAAAGFPVQLLQGSLLIVLAISFWMHTNTVPSESTSPSGHRYRIDLLLVSLITLLIVTGWAETKHTGRAIDREERDYLLERAVSGAAAVNELYLAGLTGSGADTKNPDYLRLKEQLTRLRRSINDVRFYYLLGKSGDKIYFMVDSEPETSKDYSPPGQEYDEASQSLRDIFETGRPFTEGPVTDRWGTWISGLSPIRNGDGRVIAVLGVDVDAAPLAQKIARERLHPIFITMLLSIILILFFIALRKSIDARSAIARVAKEQSLLLDTIDTQVWYLRDHETYGTVNNAHAAFLGLSKELLEHRSLREIYPDAAARMFIEVNRTLFTEKKPVSTEEWVRDSQGDMRLLDITRTPQIDPLGNVEFVVCSAEDITERNRAEEERALNLQRMHALLHLNQMTDATLQEVTDFALEEAVRMTQSTIGYLAFLNHDESVLTMHSWSKSAMKECAVTNKKIIYPVETTGLWGEAVRQRRPVITNDYSAASPWKKGCPEGHVVIRRHMNIPVFVGPRIVLVAGVGNKAKEYDQDDVRQLTLLMEGMWRLIERKRSETALQESQRMLRLVLDTIPVRVFWKDTDSTYLGCNKAFMHDAGLGSTDEIVGKDDFCMPWSSQAQLYRAYDRSVIESGVPMMNYVQPEPRADGNVTWLRTSKTPFHDSEGKIRGILGIYEDITEQKRAEDAQRESDLFLKETQRIARLGGWKANPHTDYLRWSEGVYDIIEAPKDYAPGLAEGLKYFPPEHIPIIEERLSNCLETGESFLLEVEINTYKGRRIWTELRGLAPMVEGERSFVIGTFQDITDRKKSDEERTKLEAQLIHAQKMESLGTLAGGIAHDFNNLLTGILGNVSLVLMGMNGNSQYYERLKNVEEYVQRGSDLTKQLLGFARGGKYEIKATDLGTFIQKSSEMFGRTKKEIHIHYKIQEDLWFVEVDRGQMEQVLLNLYINSWQAMPGGGDMYISVENASLGLMEVSPYGINPGRFVKVTITDTGIGMDKETQTRIFEPFFTTKERGRGSGLGLASVYGIVKNHGGFIEVESEKNLGSSFIIFLPVSEKTEVDDDSIAKDEIRKGNENILVIDDEEMILNVGSKMLEGLGYKVMTATGGTQGLEIYDRSRGSIDLIILDMIMPDFSGKETFHALLRINPSVKVLLSSGYSIDGQAREIMQSGCKGFIQKPFTMLELSKKIRRVLDG